MGRYFVDGALGRDYTLVMGTVVVVAALVIVFNLMVDLTYAWLDPRIADTKTRNERRSARFERQQGCGPPRPTNLALLALIALACVFGPMAAPHPFDRVYPDYVLAASLARIASKL